ncbi:hypothetical protein NC652_037222 [Populus alba x Populus x berolinensis]|nr:hypothetical protein NC652_037222 [Populus alba x Populus x berolinensis]
MGSKGLMITVGGNGSRMTVPCQEGVHLQTGGRRGMKSWTHQLAYKNRFEDMGLTGLTQNINPRKTRVFFTTMSPTHHENVKTENQTLEGLSSASMKRKPRLLKKRNIGEVVLNQKE